MASRTRSGRLSAALAIAAVLAGCGPAVADDIMIEWHMAAPQPVTRAMTEVEAVLRDASRAPIRGAHVEFQAHMSHPGMAPVVVAAREIGAGVYRAPLQFTMAGDWTLMASGSLADGRAFKTAEFACRVSGG